MSSITQLGYRIAAMAAALGAGMVLWLPFGTAQADVGPLAATPMPHTIAGCNQLPLSQRGICRSQVGWSQVTPSAVAIDQEASAATKAQMASCKTLPLSDRFVCEDQAGYGEKVPRGLAQNQRIALDKAQARYRVAIAACQRMPVSDRTICESQAGNDVDLARAG